MWRKFTFCDLGEGWKLTERGATEIEGDIPFNMSGGTFIQSHRGWYDSIW